MALCPLTLAPGLPPSIPPSLPGPHCFRECPHPKEEVPWSDSCPEPPWCFGEYVWRGRMEGLGELVLPLWLTVWIPVLTGVLFSGLSPTVSPAAPGLTAALSWVLHVTQHTDPGSDSYPW